VATGFTDLEQLERQAFRRFYDDGIFDVYVGAMLIVMGAGALLSDRVESEALNMLAILGMGLVVTIPLLLARRNLLRSRLGSFTPAPERRRRISRTRLVLLGSVVLGVAAFGIAAAVYKSGTGADTLAALLPVLWVANTVVVFGAFAHFLDVPRFYAVGLIAGLAMPLLIWPDLLWDRRIPPVLAFGAPGAVICGMGIFKLRGFLTRYPAPGPDHG
jgi:hypothetical protein